ncbi:MAG: hypothetical protein AAB874_07820 [Patescibacteria group bacterium]
MKYIAQNNPPSDVQNDQLAAEHFATLMALTPKEQQTTSKIPVGVENTPLTLLFSPWLIYGSIGIFFAFFLGAIIVQIINKSLDMRRTLTSLTVALVIASLPLTLKTALQITSLQTRAGPDEIPRNVKIEPVDNETAHITWDTDALKVGSVRFGPTPMNIKTATVVIADGGKRMRLHGAELKKLQKGVIYDVEILSGSEWYSDNGVPIKFKF